MLCEFAHRFPRQLAELMERDRHLTRNFREESATDLLMMSLVALEPFGVRVDFPDETVTGADMDWIYAAPHEVGGGSYLRLLIQAKRAKEQKRKDGSSYWYYNELDYGSPKGTQAKTLVDHAATSPEGMVTLPLYMFYHPEAGLRPANRHRPAVEGINVTFACDVAVVAAGGCSRDRKRVDFWRDGFLSLPDLLCWPFLESPPQPPSPPRPGATEFLSAGGFGEATFAAAAFHPDLVAERINRIARIERRVAWSADRPEAVSAEGIPDDIRRAIDGKVSEEDRKRLQRPRVIFSTPITREDPRFERARERAGRGRRLGDLPTRPNRGE